MVWGISMQANTLQVIEWAKAASEDNVVVKVFWEKLCEAANEKPVASPEKIYSEIKLYGSNTLRIIDRPEGVPYHEVAADVADKLAGWAFWQKSPYGYDTIDNCERFVLEKMEISGDDLDKLRDSVSFKANKEAALNAIGDVAGDYAKVAGVAVVGAVVAKQIGLQIAKQIVLQIAKGLNIFLAALIVIDIAGPAYRCTIPGVTYIALLRKMYIAAQKGL